MTVVNWRTLLGWSDEQLEELRFSGFSFLREGHYKKALLFFEALIVIDPTNSYDMETLGALYLQIGENEKALVTLDRALALDPNNEPTQLNKIKALITLGRQSEALDLAARLAKSEDTTIADDASALIAAYH